MLGWFKKKKDNTKGQDNAGVVSPESNTEASTAEEAAAEETDHLQGTGIFSDRSEETAVVADHVKPDEEKARPVADSTDSPSLFKRLSAKLSRTRDTFVHQMDSLFLGKKEIDAELLDDLEELLITADIGVNTSTELIDYARKKVKRQELSDPQSLKRFIKEKLRSYIVDTTRPAELVMPASGPFIIMVVGVNGVGKTTTIGKIAHKFVNSGQTVLLAAADTFRAAAVSQLKIWGERSGIEVLSRGEGADPSSVAFDAITQAVAENYDVVIVDTAGRLHTQSNLMEELKKIKRVIGKKHENAPHEILLVIDATTGQNGISQAKLFDEAVGVTGLALTKLDGTAKGGIVANISRYMNIPIRFIGIGEKIDDLRDFDPDEFIEALFQNR
ncbi:MAG TPA: signal recognition particle-docking protein FtsY [Desulfopila sp.]|nr:signal recognition particle-docking protein FtsY [Desulfopila sp.]